ncbi:hypothetical protein GW17_00044223 [Ensete ventricosum]|nr:hypothetical protein GW17_00044223 [Ensete ventricosum]RZR82699.1 hypothetical protein BHM03_00009177 [Ensete ventricosum]
MSGVEIPPKLLPTSNSDSVEYSMVPIVTEESRGNEMELDIQQSERICTREKKGVNHCTFCLKNIFVCRLKLIIGFYQMLVLALQKCGRLHVSSPKMMLSFDILRVVSLQCSFMTLTQTTAEIEWDAMGRFGTESTDDFITDGATTPRPQTPPPGVVEVPSDATSSQR